MAKRLILAGLLLALPGCAVLRPTPSPFCNTAKPLLVDKRDSLTPGTTAAILAHNKTGEALCGWGKK